jgi:hypothetical protein
MALLAARKTNGTNNNNKNSLETLTTAYSTLFSKRKEVRLLLLTPQENKSDSVICEQLIKRDLSTFPLYKPDFPI